MAERREYFVWLGGPDLADAVITSRKALGLTQTELARRARVSLAFVYLIERGKGTARSDKAIAVLRALGLVPLLLPEAVLGMLG
jgi:transcriptional regulator with XRE-family HTH domain